MIVAFSYLESIQNQIEPYFFEANTICEAGPACLCSISFMPNILSIQAFSNSCASVQHAMERS